MSKLLTVENLLSRFPRAMSEDEQQYALAVVTATELIELCAQNDMLALYARIDELEESLLDILAHDFKVDWWDGNASLDEKRDTFKNCWEVHRKKGTVMSVELFLSSVFQEVDIQEWTEYGGRPFYFRTKVTSKPPLSISRTGYEMFFRNLNAVKPVRSKLEASVFSRSVNANLYVGAAVIKTFRKFTVPAGQLPDEERGFN